MLEADAYTEKHLLVSYPPGMTGYFSGPSCLKVPPHIILSLFTPIPVTRELLNPERLQEPSLRDNQVNLLKAWDKYPK